MADSLALAKRIAGVIDSKLGEDIVCINLKGVSTVTDYLMMATGRADTHVKAIADNLLSELKKDGIAPFAHEGFSYGFWICVDYGDVMVHIMRPQEREIYDLAAIWGGAEKVELFGCR